MNGKKAESGQNVGFGVTLAKNILQNDCLPAQLPERKAVRQSARTTSLLGDVSLEIPK
jgi:hypothetical protein